ncbi:MAG: hypothetical protein IKB51_05300 [Clostridia bacterium]|nr:hypothetical protein [Clostridia bacterium]
MKNFFDIKDEKMTEKAFSQSLIISFVSILLCLVVLCSTTYAWFTSEKASSSNTLTSGSFDIAVSVKIKDGADLEPLADGSYKLEASKTYIVEINPAAGATVKGYCIVTIDDKPYKTDVILDDEMTDDTYKTATAPLTFTIDSQKADTVLKFESHWGVLLNPDIKEKASITVKDSQIEIKNDLP